MEQNNTNSNPNSTQKKKNKKPYYYGILGTVGITALISSAIYFSNDTEPKKENVDVGQKSEITAKAYVETTDVVKELERVSGILHADFKKDIANISNEKFDSVYDTLDDSTIIYSDLLVNSAKVEFENEKGVPIVNTGTPIHNSGKNYFTDFVTVIGDKEERHQFNFGINPQDMFEYIHSSKENEKSSIEFIQQNNNLTSDNLVELKKYKDYLSDKYTAKELATSNVYSVIPPVNKSVKTNMTAKGVHPSTVYVDASLVSYISDVTVDLSKVLYTHTSHSTTLMQDKEYQDIMNVFDNIALGTPKSALEKYFKNLDNKYIDSKEPSKIGLHIADDSIVIFYNLSKKEKISQTINFENGKVREKVTGVTLDTSNKASDLFKNTGQTLTTAYHEATATTDTTLVFRQLKALGDNSLLLSLNNNEVYLYEF